MSIFSAFNGPLGFCLRHNFMSFIPNCYSKKNSVTPTNADKEVLLYALNNAFPASLLSKASNLKYKNIDLFRRKIYSSDLPIYNTSFIIDQFGLDDLNNIIKYNTAIQN